MFCQNGWCLYWFIANSIFPPYRLADGLPEKRGEEYALKFFGHINWPDIVMEIFISVSSPKRIFDSVLGGLNLHSLNQTTPSEFRKLAPVDRQKTPKTETGA